MTCVFIFVTDFLLIEIIMKRLVVFKVFNNLLPALGGLKEIRGGL